MKVSNYEIFEIHAEFCKAIANPKRLIIIRALGEKEMIVSEFADLLELPVANVSQHLKALRDQDIVATRKEGQKIYYSLAVPKLLNACDIIREIVIDLNKKKGKIINLNCGNLTVLPNDK